MMRTPFLALAVLAMPALALAQTAAKPTSVSGIVVAAPAKEPPKVVATFPEAGKTVAPGAVILKVVFDQKMNPGGWDYGKGAEAYPACLERPRLLPDEKTFVLLCTVGGNRKFSVSLNNGHDGGFENVAGQRATPSAFDFATDSSQSSQTIEDAMKAAALKADEGPVMDIKPSRALASTGAAPPP
jgi:hypothetical protein